MRCKEGLIELDEANLLRALLVFDAGEDNLTILDAPALGMVA